MPVRFILKTAVMGADDRDISGFIDRAIENDLPVESIRAGRFENFAVVVAHLSGPI